MKPLTYQDVLEILRLVDSGPFADFEVEYAGTRVRVERLVETGPSGTGVQENHAPAASRSTGTTNTPTAAVATASVAGPQAGFPNAVDVKPPMAGTFYCAPAPGAEPYVVIDSPVRKGDQLGMVEVMKLFTPVVSPCDGIVRLILVRNEELVQSDQTLMVIEGEP